MSYNPNDVPNPYLFIAQALERIESRMERLEIAAGVGDAPPLAEYGDHLTTEEAAQALRVCKKTVNNWAASGRLTTVKAGKKNLFLKSEVMRLLKPN